MFSAFQTFGRLGAGARAVAAAWSPSALWPTGTEPGMWIDPSLLTASWADYTGTTPVSTPGTVADSSNPVGLALDLRLGATTPAGSGNHLLQATGTARPLLSGRVNLLQYTEDFTNGYWLNATATVTPNYGTAPDGTQTSTRLQFAGANLAILKANILSTATPAAASCYIKGTAGETLFFQNNLATSNLVTLTGAWQQAIKADGNCTSVVIGTYGGATARDIEVWHPQLELGLDATDYQSVPGDGSTYATGFPIAQLYNGVDDGMATAAFSAGTLIDGMDCMIAVRRDSAGNAVCGLYESVAEANKVFGIAESGSGSGCVGSGAGTPTVWVDGVQLTGGTAVTRGTLHTALTVGDYHVLEFRGLDLSTWTASGFGLYTSYVFTGAQGGILLFPSSTSAADRDAARTWLGAKVGLTL